MGGGRAGGGEGRLSTVSRVDWSGVQWTGAVDLRVGFERVRKERVKRCFSACSCISLFAHQPESRYKQGMLIFFHHLVSSLLPRFRACLIIVAARLFVYSQQKKLLTFCARKSEEQKNKIIPSWKPKKQINLVRVHCCLLSAERCVCTLTTLLLLGDGFASS